ncbi:hypothetical protein ACFVYT_24800 [Streptomyces sp. NPDC058290]|uniref:hypothetical protein n=1 Tax=Streptomyces sp. NPDC058290 TaxID=3346426 RepID=UPI0036EA6D89
MTVQPPLFLSGWDVEPCDTAPPDPDEQAFTDLHARHIPGDHGRPASRGTYLRLRRIHTLTIKGDIL